MSDDNSYEKIALDLLAQARATGCLHHHPVAMLQAAGMFAVAGAISEIAGLIKDAIEKAGKA